MQGVVTPRIKVQATAQVGETIEIKTLISHTMESGLRRNARGELVPRDIINSFVFSFDGTPVFSVDFGTGISANPYLAFFFRATKSGTLGFTWIDDDGARYTARQELVVS